MARLTALPSIDIVRRLAGVLDFYMWKGLPCVRAWPRYRPARQTAGSKASAALFGAIVKGYNLLGQGPLEAFRADAADHSRSARDIYVSAVLGHLHEQTIPEPPPPPEEQMYDAYVCLRDKKPEDTPGGTFTAGTWWPRDLTQEQADPENICTLAANQFVLAPGTYRCNISCPGFKCSWHKARLYNVTAAAIILMGTSEYAHYIGYAQTRTHVVGRFTVPAAQTLEIQHRGKITAADVGFGQPSDFPGTDEIYTLVELWRETE